MLCTMTKLLQSYADELKNLHSFPTRRSSDLYATGGQLWEIPAGTLDPGEDPEACARRELKEETDRKSTRLNSSHRCISYAVFCLKKKKRVNRRRGFSAISTPSFSGAVVTGRT